MEATTHNLQLWLIAICTCIFFSSPYSSYAQSNQLQARLSQLLDSAEILKYKGNYDDAIDICNQSKIGAEAIKDWSNVARANNELAEISRFIYKYDASRKFLSASKRILDKYLNYYNNELARFYLYKGKMIMELADTSQGYPDSVIFYFNESEQVLKQITNNPKELTTVILEIGKFYTSLGMTGKAKEYFSELENLLVANFNELDYHRGLVLYYLGQFYYSIGDYERVILFSELAIHILSYPSNFDEIHILQSEITLGNTHYALKEINNALIHYKNAIELANKNPQRYNDVLTVAHTNMGELLLSINSIDSSLYYSQKALVLNRGLTARDNLMKSFALLNLGKLYAKQTNYHDGEEFMQKSLSLIEETLGKKNYWTHAVYRYIGNHYEERGLLDVALNYYQQGLIALFADFDSLDIYTDPEYFKYENKEEIYYVLTEKSAALYKKFLREGNLKDLKAAFSLYSKGYEVLEELLNTGFMDESIIQVFKGFKNAFNLSIECAFDLYSETGEKEYYHQAFQFIEKSKYFLLFKALTNSLYKQNANISDELFIKERQLAQEINLLKHMLIYVPITKSDSLFTIRNSLHNKLIEKDSIWNQIDQSSQFSTRSFFDSLIVTLEDIQNNIVQNDELIIEYHWAKNYIYVLSIGKDLLEVYKFEITDELDTQINVYAEAISGESVNSTDREGFDKYINSALYLYRVLFEPVLDNNILSKNENGNINQVTIIPDGKLSYLPFESLLTEFPDTTIVSYWNLPYLLKDYSFRYAYSLNILKNNLFKQKKIKNPKLFAFSYSGVSDKNLDITRLSSQEEIRYSAEELNSIKSRIKQGDFFEDADATEELFKNRAGQYSLIHLALHGQADVKDMYNSKLIFKDGGSTDEDGELYAYELYNLDLSNTEMAVLSACETGIGQQTEGEGIFSIARGFAYAGCPSIFMSLWKVSDKATAKLMDHFYTNLVKGMPKDEALKEAKLLYIHSSTDQGAHPTNWAAFIALGNNKPIHVPSSVFKWYYGLFIGALLLIILFFLYYRKGNIYKSNFE